jgi:lipoprotein-releasing system permease protein
MRVFMVQGTVIGVVGVGLGRGRRRAAVVEPVVHRAFHRAPHRQRVDAGPNVYYISGVPTAVEARTSRWSPLVAFLMCLLATIYPGLSAPRAPDPASALRYE